MFKRVFWFGVGAGFGAGGSMWANRKVRAAVDRYTPERVRADVGDRVRRMADDLAGAVEDGRRVMAEAMADRLADRPEETDHTEQPRAQPMPPIPTVGRPINGAARPRQIGIRRAINPG
jgi:hypothetical protein